MGGDTRTRVRQDRPFDLGLAIESDQPIGLLLGLGTAPQEDEPGLPGLCHRYSDLGGHATGSSGNQHRVVRAWE